ncbi:MAG: hypothetical protein IPN44_12520 [Flavobacteriales bacterium]|nr:hypothetical protein [Flavobacteriales bacterium]
MANLYAFASFAALLLSTTTTEAQQNLRSSGLTATRAHVSALDQEPRGGGAPANDECSAAEPITIVPRGGLLHFLDHREQWIFHRIDR